MGGASAFNTAQDKVVGFVKAMAADDGHDADHAHLDLFSLTADITPTGVLLTTLNVSGEIFFVGKLVLLFTVNLLSLCSFTPKVASSAIRSARHFGKCHHLRELLRGDGAEGDHRQWHFFVAWPHFCRGLLLSSLTAIRVGETHEKKTDLGTQMATRSSKLETVVLKSCVLDSKFVELQADLGPCQDCD